MAESQNIIDVLKEVQKTLSEIGAAPAEPSVDVAAPSGAPVEQPKRKPVKVNFDKNSDSPFSAIFSERGFEINGTRLSFEELETAISKNYNITLDGGNGLALDAVKMQKILKYKDLF